MNGNDDEVIAMAKRAGIWEPFLRAFSMKESALIPYHEPTSLSLFIWANDKNNGGFIHMKFIDGTAEERARLAETTAFLWGAGLSDIRGVAAVRDK